MRHTSDQQETSIWIALSAVWFSASFLAWCAVLFSLDSLTLAAGDKLVLIAVLVSAVSLALRLPILTTAPVTTCFTNQLVWLLTMAANLNWLGCLSLRADGWLDALPPALVLVLGEIWIHRNVDRQGCLPDILASLSFLRPAYWFAASSFKAQPEPLPATDFPCPTLEVHSELGQFVRQTFAGFDDEGAPYLSGDVRVELEPLQTTTSIVVAFSPTFAGTPTVEFELEAEETGEMTGQEALARGDELTGQAELSTSSKESLGAASADAKAEEPAVQLTSCTPAGMRIGLRRSAAAGSAQRVYRLRWYASLPPEDAPWVAQANSQAALP